MQVEQQPMSHLQSHLSFISTVSLFGASTFFVVASDMADPAELRRPNDAPPLFELHTVRCFIATAWLCFIICLSVAGYVFCTFALLADNKSTGLTGVRGRGRACSGRGGDAIGICVLLVLNLLLVTAFLFLSLAMVAYVGAIGWAAVAWCCVAYIFAICFTIHQCR
jgi:hypothetical protein